MHHSCHHRTLTGETHLNMTTNQCKMRISKEKFLETLNEISSPDEERKQAAKKTLETFEVQATDELGIHLINCVIDANSSPAIAQSASAALERYVRTHWCEMAENFKPPEIGLESKTKIKQVLLYGLCMENSKVRHAMADSVSLIAKSDWPDHWPELFDTLVEYLHVKIGMGMFGSLRVLTAIVGLLDETQISNVGPVILHEMYNIFRNNEESTHKCKQALVIFTNMVAGVADYEQPELVHQYLEPSIAIFCAEFLECLRIRDDVLTDIKSRVMIINTITKIAEHSPKCIADFLPKMLSMIWEIFTLCARIYRGSTVDGGEDVLPEDIRDLVSSIFNLIEVMMDGTHKDASYRPEYNLQDYQWLYLQHGLPLDAIQRMTVFIEITDKQIEDWTNDPSRFLTEEKLIVGAKSAPSIRRNAKDILLRIVDCPGGPAADALCDTIQKQTKDKSDASENWWKSHEASIEVFGILKNVILEKQMAGTSSFDVAAFLEDVILVDLDNPELDPFLIGRCLYVGGLYAEQMPLELRSKFLECTINCLRNRQACARLCAAKAATFWLRAFSAEADTDQNDNILGTQLPVLFQELFNLGNQLISVEALTIVMENLAALTSIHTAFTTLVESGICTLTIRAFLNFSSDYYLCQYCREIFTNLMQNPRCMKPLLTRLIPMLVTELAANPSEKTGHGIEDDILDLLNLLVERSPQPPSNILIEIAFPASCHFILSSFEYHTVLRGSRLIRQFLSVAAQQVLGYRDGDDKSGLEYVLPVAVHLFDYEASPFYRRPFAMFRREERVDEVASDIATTLIKLRALQENMNPLLQAVLNRLQHVESWIVPRLLLVYVHVMNSQFDAFIDFLSTAPDFGERSALSFVICDGFCKQFGKFQRRERKLVTLVLSKILVHAVGHPNFQLHGMTFEETDEDARTTKIPVLIKIGNIITDEISRDVKFQDEAED